MTQENASTPAVKPIDEKKLKPIIFAAVILLLLNLIMLFLPFCEVYQPTRKVTNVLGTTYEGWHLSSNSLVSVMVGIPVMIGYIITLFKWCRGIKPDKIYADLKAQMSKRINKFILLKIAAIYSVVMPIFLFMGVNSSVSPYKEHGAYCNFTGFGAIGIITNVALFAVLIYLSGASKSLYIHSLVNATKSAEQESTGAAAAVGSAAAMAYAASTNIHEVNADVSSSDSVGITREQSLANSETPTEQAESSAEAAAQGSVPGTSGYTTPSLVSKIIPGATDVIGKAANVVGTVADKTVQAFKTKKWLRIAAPIAVCAIILVTIIVSLLGSGGTFTPKKTDEELIRERIDTFLTAYNDGDMEEVLNCLDAKTKNTFNALLNVMGGLAGGLTGFSFDLRDLFSLGVAVMDGYYSLNFEVSSVEISGSNAVATATMNVSPTEFATVYISLKYESDGWYINDISDKKPVISGENGTGTESGSETGTESGSGSGTEGSGSVPSTDNIDESFLSANTPSQGLNFQLNSSSDGYILTGMGDCTDTHVVIPEYPSEYNEIPVDTVDLYSLSASYVTIPSSVKHINGGSSNIKAINFLGTLDDWCSIDFSGYWGNFALSATVLYINGTKISGNLTIPSSITEISNYAFYSYDELTSVKASAQTIGEYAFAECPNLKTAYLNSGVNQVGNNAFNNSGALESVTFCDSIKYIGEGAFANCIALGSIKLGDNVESIGEMAFYNCTALASVELGDKIVFTGENAFGNTAYYNDTANWKKGVLYIDGYIYDAKDDVISVTVNEGTIGIMSNAFKSHEHLQSILLPNSVKRIGEGAFYWCRYLDEITLSTKLEYIGENAFYGCRSLNSVKFNGTPDGIRYLGSGNDDIKNLSAYNTITGENVWWVTAKFEYNGHTYLVKWGVPEWDNARLACEAMGGHLATLTSKEENDAVYEYIKNYDIDEAYFGLTNIGGDGSWRWITGELFAYSNWTAGYPSMSSTNHYGKFYGYKSNAWNNKNGDMYGNYSGYTPYICEWDN